MSNPTAATLPGATHPLSRLLAALDAGACRSVRDLGRVCDLPVDDVQAALATLESVGRVRRVPLLAASCSPDGCTSCGTRLGCPLASASSASTLQTWQAVPR